MSRRTAVLERAAQIAAGEIEVSGERSLTQHLPVPTDWFTLDHALREMVRHVCEDLRANDPSLAGATEEEVQARLKPGMVTVSHSPHGVELAYRAEGEASPARWSQALCPPGCPEMSPHAHWTSPSGEEWVRRPAWEPPDG